MRVHTLPTGWAQPRAGFHFPVVRPSRPRCSRARRPIRSGARLNMTIDMQVRELTLELIGPDGLTVLSSINVENIPGEVRRVGRRVWDAVCNVEGFPGEVSSREAPCSGWLALCSSLLSPVRLCSSGRLQSR